jgi:hypothetical protein
METEIQKETKKIANALALELLTTLDMSEKPKTKTIDASTPNSTWSDKAKELHKQLLDLAQNQHFRVFNYAPDYANWVEVSPDGKISIKYSS